MGDRYYNGGHLWSRNKDYNIRDVQSRYSQPPKILAVQNRLGGLESFLLMIKKGAS